MLVGDIGSSNAEVAPPPDGGGTGAPDRGARIRHLAVGVAIWGVLLAITAALVGGGGWLLYQRTYGTRAEATVVACESSGGFARYGSGYRTECIAEWTIDGETVVGNYEVGDGEGEVGETVDVTVRGDTAYSRSLGLPILLLALGLPFLVLVAFAVRNAIRDRRSRTYPVRTGAEDRPPDGAPK